MQNQLGPESCDSQSWQGCQIKPVWPEQQVHALHAYFNCCPESPDGRWIVLFVSEQADAQVGDICLVERATDRTLILDQGVQVEDAHRQAMQQWSANGQYVIYMKPCQNQWQVIRADVKTRELTVLFTGAQLFCGQPLQDHVPLYGMPWAPGEHRDLVLLNVRTGEYRTAVTLKQVLADHALVIERMFDGRVPDSIAYPVLSPDGSRVFFKLSCVGDKQYRSNKASLREGLFVYDLHKALPLGLYPSWGHPAWMPDSKHVLRMNVIIDTDTMQTREIPWYPSQSNSHASSSPDGTMLVMDVARDAFTAKEFHWAIVVGDDQTNWHRIHTDPAPRHGTTSWRPAHPHPVFSADGKRIYFNANMGDWTSLQVAHCID
tara:strand:- start:76911 stop:78035 length:1125 start_codon:yes stop_codon:yes gene_type:complete